VAAFGLACSRKSAPSSAARERLTNVPAVVCRFPIDSDNFVLRDSTGAFYVPEDLPVPFRSEGVRVLFSARLLPIPPGVRMVGPPVRLERIERIDGRAS
jgi:hypothetical protein